METKDEKLIYADLTYIIRGALFEVFNTLGYGYREVYYQRALVKEFKDLGLEFQEQAAFPLIFKVLKIGRGICDFYIEGRVILEIKQGDRFSRHDIKQLYTYLKASGLKLGILVRFSSKGLKFRRVLNIW